MTLRLPKLACAFKQQAGAIVVQLKARNDNPHRLSQGQVNYSQANCKSAAANYTVVYEVGPVCDSLVQCADQP